MVTDDEDFVDIEEQEEMQPLSFDSDDSSSDADDMDVEYIDDEDESMDNELLRDLQNWSFEFKIWHSVINALMEILRNAPHSQFKTLPKDARALLKTPKKTAEIVALSGGSYYHFGLSNTLEVLLLHYKNDISNQVHIIGLFYGKKKPKNANEFLQQFVKELIPEDIMATRAVLNVPLMKITLTPKCAFLMKKVHSELTKKLYVKQILTIIKENPQFFSLYLI
ncbi:atp synthase subunit mitochondrial [Lasius niger]|uniref:Atp synthase subunit mitochondrial n=1 Tax=Lasius niger TaxID=67767 RepID=A0A0J7K548_LASNI|nr:atp synthase subunit mitochondrial [Lasius niger]